MVFFMWQDFKKTIVNELFVKIMDMETRHFSAILLISLVLAWITAFLIPSEWEYGAKRSIIAFVTLIPIGITYIIVRWVSLEKYRMSKSEDERD